MDPSHAWPIHYRPVRSHQIRGSESGLHRQARTRGSHWNPERVVILEDKAL